RLSRHPSLDQTARTLASPRHEATALSLLRYQCYQFSGSTPPALRVDRTGAGPTTGERGKALVGFQGRGFAMAYNPAFVILSSLKPLFFNSLKNELCFSDSAGA